MRLPTRRIHRHCVGGVGDRVLAVGASVERVVPRLRHTRLRRSHQRGRGVPGLVLAQIRLPSRLDWSDCRPRHHRPHRDRARWSIRRFVRTTRRCRTVEIRRGQKLLTGRRRAPERLTRRPRDQHRTVRSDSLRTGHAGRMSANETKGKAASAPSARGGARVRSAALRPESAPSITSS